MYLAFLLQTRRASRSDPIYSSKQVLANSVDPDQTSSSIISVSTLFIIQSAPFWPIDVR